MLNRLIQGCSRLGDDPAGGQGDKYPTTRDGLGLDGWNEKLVRGRGSLGSGSSTLEIGSSNVVSGDVPQCRYQGSVWGVPRFWFASRFRVESMDLMHDSRPLPRLGGNLAL